MVRTARVALLQLPAFDADNAAASLAHTLRRIDECASRHHPDIIALPEVTYPGYFLGSEELHHTVNLEEATGLLAERARSHQSYIAAGWAVDVDGRLRNSGVLFGRDGSLVGRYDKSFLWHFDHKWFDAGSAYPVFDTDVGRVGILICADGRMPEIARSLVLNGAQLILDLTAWVSGARKAADLTTTQAQHLMRCRAAENGVWIACADKFGVEAESIVYAGRSCVVNPQGEIVASLGTDEDAELVFEVPINDATPPVSRRPDLYEVLAHPTDSLPVMRTLSEPLVIADEERRIAVVQMTMPDSVDAFLVKAEAHVARQRLMDASVVIFPAPPSRLREFYVEGALGPPMRSLAKQHHVMIAYTAWSPDGTGLRAMHLVGPSGAIAQHAQTHKPPGARFESMPLGDQPCPVVRTSIGRVGMMLAAEGYVPEVARSLMLRGAEFILWSADDPSLDMEIVARTRAEENRVYVACAAAPTATGASLVADPGGRVLAIALEGRELAVGAEVNRALSHVKERAPGTDVVRNRQPGTYSAITGAGVAAADH
jgi:predicted amidohydrolase